MHLFRSWFHLIFIFRRLFGVLWSCLAVLDNFLVIFARVWCASEKFHKTWRMGSQTTSKVHGDPTCVVPREHFLCFFFAAGFVPARCIWHSKNADAGEKSRQFKHVIFPLIRVNMIPLIIIVYVSKTFWCFLPALESWASAAATPHKTSRKQKPTRAVPRGG